MFKIVVLLARMKREVGLYVTAPTIWQFRIIYKSDIVNGKIRDVFF